MQKRLLQNDNSDPITYSVTFQILTGTLIFLYSLASNQFVWHPLTPVLPNFILMMILYGLGNIFVFQALKAVEASKFTILFAARGLFTVIASTLFLRELLTSYQYLGGILILLSIIIAVIKRNQLRFETHDKLALLAAFFFGIASANDRYLLTALNLYQFVVLSFVLSGMLVGVVYYRKLLLIRSILNTSIYKKMFALSLVYGLSAVFFFASLQIAPSASQVAVINLTSTITIVLLGVVLLKERDNLRQKMIGALLAFLGLVLISR